MSTFEDWLEGQKLSEPPPLLNDSYLAGCNDAIEQVQDKRKEMVCANCEHFQPLTNCSYFGAGVFVSPDFYCKSFIMKGEE